MAPTCREKTRAHLAIQLLTQPRAKQSMHNAFLMHLLSFFSFSWFSIWNNYIAYNFALDRRWQKEEIEKVEIRSITNARAEKIYLLKEEKRNTHKHSNTIRFRCELLFTLHTHISSIEFLRYARLFAIQMRVWRKLVHKAITATTFLYGALPTHRTWSANIETVETNSTIEKKGEHESNSNIDQKEDFRFLLCVYAVCFFITNVIKCFFLFQRISIRILCCCCCCFKCSLLFSIIIIFCYSSHFFYFRNQFIEEKKKKPFNFLVNGKKTHWIY